MVEALRRTRPQDWLDTSQAGDRWPIVRDRNHAPYWMVRAGRCRHVDDHRRLRRGWRLGCGAGDGRGCEPDDPFTLSGTVALPGADADADAPTGQRAARYRIAFRRRPLDRLGRRLQHDRGRARRRPVLDDVSPERRHPGDRAGCEPDRLGDLHRDRCEGAAGQYRDRGGPLRPVRRAAELRRRDRRRGRLGAAVRDELLVELPDGGADRFGRRKLVDHAAGRNDRADDDRLQRAAVRDGLGGLLVHRLRAAAFDRNQRLRADDGVRCGALRAGRQVGGGRRVPRAGRLGSESADGGGG